MSHVKLRPYQTDAVNAVFDYWRNEGGNPLIDMATGLGKSMVVATLVRDVLTKYPDMRILVLVHVQELVEQDFTALIRLWPQASAGIYSAGLGRRDAHHRITFASIQSVFRKGREIGPRDLVLIDEAHLVPKAGEGMYLTLLEALRDVTPDLRVAGLTATAFRLDSGRLDQGEGRLFDEIVYHYGVGEGVEDGWLAPLTCRAASIEIDVSDVAKRGGEFVSGALEAAADKDELTRAAVEEIMQRAGNRRSWLIFCSGVKHAQHVCAALNAQDVPCGVVTGETPKDIRRQLIADFKAGKLRALTNAQVLTTGFDAPQTDLIAFLRPTLSTGLYVQMLGRGTRPVWPPGFDPNAHTKEERLAAIEGSTKANCLVLDFAGNVRRHGPVDAVIVRDKKAKGEGVDLEGFEGEFKVKVDSVRSIACVECNTYSPIGTKACPDCGHEFPEPERKIKHEKKPEEDVAVLARDLKPAQTIEHPVVRWLANVHHKIGATNTTMKVSYYAGLMEVPEWIAFEHNGYARTLADKWWHEHGGEFPAPRTTEEALRRFEAGEVRMPRAIFTRKENGWDRIVGRRFAEEAA